MSGESIYNQVNELVEDFCNKVYGMHPHNTGIFNAMVLAVDKHNILYGVDATYNFLRDLKDYGWVDIGDSILVSIEDAEHGEGCTVYVTFNGVSQDYVVVV